MGLYSGYHSRRDYSCVVCFVLYLFIHDKAVDMNISSVWYIFGAHRYYTGPKSNLHNDSVEVITQDFLPNKDKKTAA